MKDSSEIADCRGQIADLKLTQVPHPSFAFFAKRGWGFFSLSSRPTRPQARLRAEDERAICSSPLPITNSLVNYQTLHAFWLTMGASALQ